MLNYLIGAVLELILLGAIALCCAAMYVIARMD